MKLAFTEGLGTDKAKVVLVSESDSDSISVYFLDFTGSCESEEVISLSDPHNVYSIAMKIKRWVERGTTVFNADEYACAIRAAFGIKIVDIDPEKDFAMEVVKPYYTGSLNFDDKKLQWEASSKEDIALETKRTIVKFAGQIGDKKYITGDIEYTETARLNEVTKLMSSVYNSMESAT